MKPSRRLVTPDPYRPKIEYNKRLLFLLSKEIEFFTYCYERFPGETICNKISKETAKTPLYCLVVRLRGTLLGGQTQTRSESEEIEVTYEVISSCKTSSFMSCVLTRLHLLDPRALF